MRWQRTTLPLQAKPKCWQPHLYPSGGGLAGSITHPLKSKMLPTTLQLQSGSASVAVIAIATMVTANINALMVFIFWLTIQTEILHDLFVSLYEVSNCVELFLEVLLLLKCPDTSPC